MENIDRLKVLVETYLINSPLYIAYETRYCDIRMTTDFIVLALIKDGYIVEDKKDGVE